MPKRSPNPPTRIDPRAKAREQGVDEPDRTGRGPPSDPLRLPHERDESPLPARSRAVGRERDRSSGGPRDVIRQAARDVARGLVDTERRGTPSDPPGPRRRRSPR